MDSDSERSSWTRKWWLLIGGVAAFVVVFSLIESLVRTEPTPHEAGPTGIAALSPPPPQVRRLDDGAVEIHHDFFRRTTIRLGNEDDEKALFDCLAQGIERTFADGTEGWDRGRVRDETQRIQNECMDPYGMPTPPRPPRPLGPGN